MLKFFGSSQINLFVKDYFSRRDDLQDKVVVDIPAGTGDLSRFLQERGACVKAFDLFPEFFDVEGLTCEAADLQGTLPLEDHSADFILFQEGIEHMPDQLHVLRELNRILKPDGRLLVTTPSISHLRARVSNLLTESELYKRLPPNELDALWFAEEGRMYYGHLFLIGIQRLRVLAVAAGLNIHKVHTVRASASSLLLGVLYPLIYLVNWLAYRRNLRKDDDIPLEAKERVYGEIMRLNTSPTILFGRHLFIEFSKACDATDADLYVNLRQ